MESASRQPRLMGMALMVNRRPAETTLQGCPDMEVAGAVFAFSTVHPPGYLSIVWDEGKVYG